MSTTPDQILDWLATNDSYAKAIVGLTGIKTFPIKEGLTVDVAALWDGSEFMPPIGYSLVSDAGRISWSTDNPKSRLFRLTLGLLRDTWRELALPSRVFVFTAKVDPNSGDKKPHFAKILVRPATQVFPKWEDDQVWLRDKSWKLTDLQQKIKDLVQLKRKLRGIGYGH